MSGFFTQNLGSEVFISGIETFGVDTGNPPGQPQIAALSTRQVAGALEANFKNLIVGGDFGLNLWQRAQAGNAVGTYSASPTFTTGTNYWADAFAVTSGAATGVSVSRVVATVANSAGIINNDAFSAFAQVQRVAAQTGVLPIQFGQVIESLFMNGLIGNWLTLSFWANPGALFSPAGGVITPKVYLGSGAEDTFANMITGSWTNSFNPSIFTVADNSANIVTQSAVGLTYGPQLTNVTTTGIALSSGWNRYQVTFFVPQTLNTATPVLTTKLGFTLNWTPVGTAGASDFVQFAGMQLEVVAANRPFATLFENRSPVIEALLQYRRCWVLFEAAGIIPSQSSNVINAVTNSVPYNFQFPVPMRAAPAAPTVTTGGWVVSQDGGANAAATLVNTGATQSPFVGQIRQTVPTTTAAVHSNVMIGVGVTGSVIFSADY